MPPSATSSPASATRSSTENRLIPGSSSFRTVDGPDEVRHHEVVEVEPCLAHERTQRVGAPQAAQARGRKGAHAHNLRGGVGGSPLLS